MEPATYGDGKAGVEVSQPIGLHQFRRLIGSDTVHFLETYPASEGFVAAEDPRHRMLRLLPDHDTAVALEQACFRRGLLEVTVI